MGGDPGIPFGNYTLLRRIARGGMAEVFVARQKGSDGFDRLVAVKRILPHLLDDKSFVGMFQDEARLAARLSHPNVIHIYDFGKVDEHFFIAMEFMHGVHAGDLIRFAEEQPMPVELVARIGADACAGLHYAHHRCDEHGKPLKLVHRDVSPPNLLVSYDGVVKIVDFGIAKAVSSIEQTRPGVVKGKYAYMSPEQTMGRPLDGRSDVFSLALVLWELLSGKPAVTRTDQVLAMKTIRDGKVPPIETVCEDLPKALVYAMQGALEKDPTERSDARAFGKELESFIKSTSKTATSEKLGDWLIERSPATTLEAEATAEASELLSDLAELDAPRGKDSSRGAVVSSVPSDDSVDVNQEETRVLAASGDMRANSPNVIAPMPTGESVLVDSELMAGHQTETNQLLLPDGDEYVIGTHELGHLGFAEDSEDTAIVTALTKPLPDDDVLDAEDDYDGARTTNRTDGVGYGAPTIVQDTPRESAPAGGAQPKHPSSQGQESFSGSYGQITPRTQAAPYGAMNPSTAARNKIWIGAAAFVVFIVLVALIGGDDKPTATKAAAPTDDQIQVKPLKAGSRSAPKMLVTSLLDAGAVAVADVPGVEHRNVGQLAATTTPDSHIYHKGRKLGSTPTTLPLPPGEYHLVFKNPRFSSVSKTVVIRTGQKTRLDFAFE